MRASIIIPNYNYGRYLGSAIESALVQTHPASEVIVCDDGSTDDSLQVASRYPVRIIERLHEGAPKTMAAGIAASHGDAFVLLNADDCMAPNYLEKTMTILQRDPRIAFVYTAVTLFGSVHDFVPARRYSLARLLAANYVHGSSLVRRAAYNGTVGLANIDLPMYEDWYLTLEMIAAGWTAARTNATTLYYRQHGPSRNKTIGEEHEMAIWAIMRDHPTLYWPSPQLWHTLHRTLFVRHPQAYVAAALALCRLRGRHDC